MKTISAICFIHHRAYYSVQGLKKYQSIGLKEQLTIFELVTNELKQAPVVIDSDDLVTQPGTPSRTC